MYTLSVITEISPDQFLPHVPSMAFLFSSMLNSVQDLSSDLAYYTVLTMIHFVPLAEGNQGVSYIFVIMFLSKSNIISNACVYIHMLYFLPLLMGGSCIQ